MENRRRAGNSRKNSEFSSIILIFNVRLVWEGKVRQERGHLPIFAKWLLLFYFFYKRKLKVIQLCFFSPLILEMNKEYEYIIFILVVVLPNLMEKPKFSWHDAFSQTHVVKRLIHEECMPIQAITL